MIEIKDIEKRLNNYLDDTIIHVLGNTEKEYLKESLENQFMFVYGFIEIAQNIGIISNEEQDKLLQLANDWESWTEKEVKQNEKD